MQNWSFLQLNPEDLRKPSSRMAPDTVSHSGANLAAALHRLKTDDNSILDDISIELNNLLPNFIRVDVSEELTENRFVIKLISDDRREFTSRVLSEGTLRILKKSQFGFQNLFLKFLVTKGIVLKLLNLSQL